MSRQRHTSGVLRNRHPLLESFDGRTARGRGVFGHRVHPLREARNHDNEQSGVRETRRFVPNNVRRHVIVSKNFNPNFFDSWTTLNANLFI